VTMYDIPIETLRATTTLAVAPENLAAFWDETLEDSAGVGFEPRFEPVRTPYVALETFDVTFAGFAGDPIRAWLHLPRDRSGPVPCVVEFAGYGCGRGLVHQTTMWAHAGFAHLVMDTRGQGSEGSPGDTPDPHGTSPAFPGLMTRGAIDPATHYYRRVFTDAVRAVEVARAHPAVDPSAVAVAGVSQGGGIAIAAAALSPHVCALSASVPYLCDMQRGAETTERLPFAEIAGYLAIHRDHAEVLFRTLSYFDGTVLGPRATAPALFSVALMDSVVPPSTIYAGFNAYGGPKSIVEYRYNDHEGGGPFHQLKEIEWMARQVADRRTS
jgi:cephalosporin-C deacetylase